MSVALNYWKIESTKRGVLCHKIQHIFFSATFKNESYLGLPKRYEHFVTKEVAAIPEWYPSIITSSWKVCKVFAIMKMEEIWCSRIKDTSKRQTCAKWENDATKAFYNATITDRLRTVSWSNNKHLTGVVNLNLTKGPTLPFPATSVQSKGQTFISINKPQYIAQWVL